jgi:hypothetical protein
MCILSPTRFQHDWCASFLMVCCAACAGLDLQAAVQPLLPAYNYLCDVIQKGTAALLKVRPQAPSGASGIQ